MPKKENNKTQVPYSQTKQNKKKLVKEKDQDEIAVLKRPASLSIPEKIITFFRGR